jgi:flavin reductase (DIM6/NTAB) family NADH-FMN oxidoreductase RutF
MTQNIDLRTAMRRVPSVVTVVTYVSEGTTMGMTIGSLTSVSLDPPLISFNVGVQSRAYTRMKPGTCVAVHVLSADRSDLSNRFARSYAEAESEFDGLSITTWSEDSLKVLEEGFVTRMVGRVVSVAPAGDHHLILVEVGEITDGPDETAPLLYYNRSYVAPGQSSDQQ